MILMALEDLGFCSKGEAGKFVEAGGIDYDGGLPFNTAAVAMTIVDSSGTEVGSGTAPVNALGVGLTTFETPGVVLTGGETYTVRLTTQESDSAGRVFVLMNPTVDDEPTREDGRLVDGDVMLQVVGSPQ